LQPTITTFQMTLRRRFPAEWEPQIAVQLTLPHAGTDWADVLDEVMPCFVNLATAISRFQQVLIVCQDAAAAKPLFAGANAHNLIFAEVDSNDTWARDHGPISVVDDGTALLVDFVFNGWGLKFAADKDNRITAGLRDKGVLPGNMEHGGIVLEGGGIESDGQGTLLTTPTAIRTSLNRRLRHSSWPSSACNVCFG
jgi:agmatine deiminase